MASDHAVRVLEESRVSPPPGSVRASLPLTFFDVLWLFSHPVQRLYFYRFPHPIKYFTDSFLPNLKTSLSLSLQHFYPLAGMLKPSADSEDQFEICYTDGDSVSFTLAECDGDFHEVSVGRVCDFAKIHPLAPLLPDSGDVKPLLAIQVTVFPDHGICIGVAVQHVAGDGLSSISFVKSWASACRSGGSAPLVAPPPLYDRTLISDPRGLYSIFLNEMLRPKSNQPVGSWMGLTSETDGIFATFTLGRDHIQRLKQRVAAKAESFRCSTFVISCAYMWVCLVKARGYESNRSAHFAFAVDCRGRLHPPVPASYFGNCVGPAFVELKAGDLTGEDGVLAASEAIGKAIEGLKDGVLEGAEIWIPKLKLLASQQLLSVAGSPKFQVYDTDFGCGRPQRVEIPSIQPTEAFSLAESREEQGGVEIGLALQKQELDEFQTHFNNGLQLHQTEL